MRRAPKHPFRFKITGTDGKPQILTSWAKVKYCSSKKVIDLILRANHVRRSIAMRGMGNTQTCSMAVCAGDHAADFPHPVEGYIDWQYSRAYVVSKLDKNGMPIECYVYGHKDDIAKVNDTKGGQQRLLRELEERGDRVIRLYPIQRGSHSTKPRGEGRRTGARSSRPAGVGAKLRFAIAQLGGVPA